MRKRFPRWLTLLAVLVVLVAALGTTVSAAGNPTEEPGSKMIVCADCNETGLCMTCYGQDPACSDCGGHLSLFCLRGTGYVESPAISIIRCGACSPGDCHCLGPDHQGGVLLPCSSGFWWAVCSIPTLALRNGPPCLFGRDRGLPVGQLQCGYPYIPCDSGGHGMPDEPG